MSTWVHCIAAVVLTAAVQARVRSKRKTATMQYTGLALIAAMQVLAVAFHQARQFDLCCFNAGSLLLQSCVLVESMKILESWYGREWSRFVSPPTIVPATEPSLLVSILMPVVLQIESLVV